MNRDSNKFNIEVSSDLDYEKMVVNLNFGNDQVAILNCDKGIDHSEIQIIDKNEEKIIWSFSYNDFFNALCSAFEKLRQANS